MNKRIKKKISKSFRGVNRCTLSRLDTLLNRTKKAEIGFITFSSTTKRPKKFDYVETKVITWDISHYRSFNQFTVLPTNSGRNPKKRYPGNIAVYNYDEYFVISDLINNIDYTIDLIDNRIMYGKFIEKSVFSNAIFLYEKIETSNFETLKISLIKIVNEALEIERVKDELESMIEVVKNFKIDTNIDESTVEDMISSPHFPVMGLMKDIPGLYNLGLKPLDISKKSLPTTGFNVGELFKPM